MNENDFIVISDENIQKVISSGVTTLNVPAYTTFPPPPEYSLFEFSHGLGYIPSARVWYEPVAGYWLPMSNISYQDTVLNTEIRGSFYLTDSSLFIKMQETYFAYDINIMYRVYLDN